MSNLQISVCIPLFNEEESLPELHAWIKRVMNANSFSYEIIFVDDGSTDNSWECIRTLCKKHSTTQGIRFARNFGKSQALHSGFAQAKAPLFPSLSSETSWL